MIRNPFGALGTVLLFLPSIATAQLDCIVPTRENTSGSGLAITHPALASIRKAALAVEMIHKQNLIFMKGARPIRVRTTIQYSQSSPWTANVFVGAYNQEAWVGKCDLNPNADRGGGLRDGAIQVHINEPRGLLGYPVGDASLEIFESPSPIALTAKYPTYRNSVGDTIVLTATGVLPWTPVTIVEALDFEERRLEERMAELEREKKKPWMSDAKVQKCVGDLKKINPAMAEDACGGLRLAFQDEQQQRRQREANMDAHLAAQRDDLLAYRASFSAAQLQQPARPNGNRESGIGRVDDPNGQMRVKVDPAFRRLDPNKIHLIYVSPQRAMSTDTIPGRFQWMKNYSEAIDYAALAKLLQ
jgi:hypothetical protein